MLGSSKNNDPDRQEILNELKTEILDYRAARLNRWLQIIGLILTFFALALPVAGFLGFQEFRSLEREAKRLTGEVQTAQAAVEEMLGDVVAAEAKVESAEAKLRSQTEVLGTVEEKVNQLDVVVQAAAAATVLDSLLPGRGFESSGDRTGSLASGARQRETFSLLPGDYRFTAACDMDCADLDLILYRDGEEEPAAEDLLLDAFPIIDFEVNESENVVLEVVMVECSEDPCTWNLSAYRRN